MENRTELEIELIEKATQMYGVRPSELTGKKIVPIVTTSYYNAGDNAVIVGQDGDKELFVRFETKRQGSRFWFIQGEQDVHWKFVD